MTSPNCTVSWVQRTRSGEDSDGNDVFTDVPISRPGVFAPGGSTETTVGGDRVVEQPTVYLTEPAPSAVDALTVDGDEYEVDGDPEVWPTSPFTGWRPEYPVVVRLKAVSG